MYCGLPSILVSQNDTQRNLTRQWKTLGAALNVEDNLAKVIKYLVDFSFDVDYLNKVRNKGLNMVDGKELQEYQYYIKGIVRMNIKYPTQNKISSK